MSERARFRRDVVWNLGALGLAGVSGIALNTLLVLAYDTTVLGVFNQVFAAYIFFSQIAVLGVHLSGLKHVASAKSDACASVVWSAYAAVGLTSLFAAAGAWVLADPIASMLDSPDVAVGIVCIVPALVLFALNKVALGCLNGLRWMRAYAGLFMGRVVLMLGTLGVLILADAPARYAPVVFVVAEFVTLVVATGLLLRIVGVGRVTRAWVQEHLSFGVRGAVSGVVVELNTRVDVLMLGVFATDSVVGVYSYAAMVAEGFFQAIVVIRNNYNPLLARLLAEDNKKDLRTLVHRGLRGTFGFMIPLGAAALTVGWGLTRFAPHPEIEQGYLLFAILVSGIVLSAGYAAFGQVLVQAGRPGAHSVMVSLVLGFNVVANALLIPHYADVGAAIATSLAFVASAVLISVFARRLLALHI